MELIKKYEGCSLKAYKCPANYWTIGFGNRFYLNGQEVKEGDEISLAYANKLLFEEVQEIKRKLPAELKNNLTTNQLDAVISLIFNIGLGAFLRSGLYKHIMNKDYKLIHREWNWFTGGGKLLKGLVKRRCEELNLFMQDI